MQLMASVPEHSLALQEVLESQQTLFPLGPVGAGAVVQDLSHVLRLTQVMRGGAVTWAEGALGAGAGRVTVSVVIRVHAGRFVPPPHRPPLQHINHTHVCQILLRLHHDACRSNLKELTLIRQKRDMQRIDSHGCFQTITLPNTVNYTVKSFWTVRLLMFFSSKITAKAVILWNISTI